MTQIRLGNGSFCQRKILWWKMPTVTKVVFTVYLVAPFCLSIYITPLLTNGSTLLLFEKGKYHRVTLNIF